MWGWIGGALGVAVGLGSAAIAIFVEGANAYQSSPYPPFFTKRQILAYDAFLGVVVVVGAAFGIAAMVLARRSRFPRTDALGAALAGTILMVLGSALLFTRLVAVVRGQ
jgi:ABC-type Mn2+/Zn2+ transport system permease subunit